MGEVWLARDDDSGRLVAVKRMLSHLAYDTRAAEMFRDEAKIASQLDHPTIVRIVDVGQRDNIHYLVMEFVEGETLAHVVERAKKQKHPMPVRLALAVVAEVAAGLDHAHTRTDGRGRPLGIIHRDVTPPNIMITDEGEVKVLDFGIAKAVDRVARTQAGAFKGKVEYLAPEQIQGATIDARTDLFSLGAVLFELLTQKKLFLKETMVGTLNAITECRVPPPSRINKEVSPTVDALVLRALARSPDLRFPSARAMEEALRGLLGARPPSSFEIARYVGELFPDEQAERLRLSMPPERLPSSPVDLDEATESGAKANPVPREPAEEEPTQVGLAKVDDPYDDEPPPNQRISPASTVPSSPPSARLHEPLAVAATETTSGAILSMPPPATVEEDTNPSGDPAVTASHDTALEEMRGPLEERTPPPTPARTRRLSPQNGRELAPIALPDEGDEDSVLGAQLRRSRFMVVGGLVSLAVAVSILLGAMVLRRGPEAPARFSPAAVPDPPLVPTSTAPRVSAVEVADPGPEAARGPEPAEAPEALASPAPSASPEPSRSPPEAAPRRTPSPTPPEEARPSPRARPKGLTTTPTKSAERPRPPRPRPRKKEPEADVEIEVE